MFHYSISSRRRKDTHVSLRKGKDFLIHPCLITKGKGYPCLITKGKGYHVSLRKGNDFLMHPCLITKGKGYLCLITKGKGYPFLITKGKWLPNLIVGLGSISSIKKSVRLVGPGFKIYSTSKIADVNFIFADVKWFLHVLRRHFFADAKKSELERLCF